MKLGFIGLGLMGEAMAANLVKKSDETVTVFDFIPEKVQALAEIGAVAAASSAEVVQNADIIFTSVPKAEHVQAVHESVYDVIRTGQIFVEMSTISPEDSIRLAKKIAEYGAVMLDAPLVKSRQAAIDGTLGVYVGGNREAFEAVRKYLSCIGSNVLYLGDNGQGLVMKICHNLLVGQIQNGVNETMLLAKKYGIEWNSFANAISIGGGKNMYLETKAKAIGTADYTTAFSIENMAKDVTIAWGMMQSAGLELPGSKHVIQIYREAMERGYAKEDFCATAKVVETDAEK